MKAIFCDFYGTAVHQNGPITHDVVKRIYSHGRAGSPDEVIRYWFACYGKLSDAACGSDYRSQDAVALETFETLLAHFHCQEDPVLLRDRMNEHWSNPPIYADTGRFLDDAPLPVYFVSNSDDRYILKAIENHSLQPAGVITSEQAKYTKPHAELFQYALDTLGLRAEEVIHIGDSLGGDVKCPASIGIRALWLNRDALPVPEGVMAVADLQEAHQAICDILRAEIWLTGDDNP